MNQTDQWKEEECFQLIEIYKSFDILWNQKNANHFRKINKEHA